MNKPPVLEASYHPLLSRDGSAVLFHRDRGTGTYPARFQLGTLYPRQALCTWRWMAWWTGSWWVKDRNFQIKFISSSFFQHRSFQPPSIFSHVESCQHFASELQAFWAMQLKCLYQPWSSLKYDKTQVIMGFPQKQVTLAGKAMVVKTPFLRASTRSCAWPPLVDKFGFHAYTKTSPGNEEITTFDCSFKCNSVSFLIMRSKNASRLLHREITLILIAKNRLNHISCLNHIFDDKIQQNVLVLWATRGPPVARTFVTFESASFFFSPGHEMLTRFDLQKLTAVERNKNVWDWMGC